MTGVPEFIRLRELWVFYHENCEICIIYIVFYHIITGVHYLHNARWWKRGRKIYIPCVQMECTHPLVVGKENIDPLVVEKEGTNPLW